MTDGALTEGLCRRQFQSHSGFKGGRWEGGSGRGHRRREDPPLISSRRRKRRQEKNEKKRVADLGRFSPSLEQVQCRL